MKTLSISKALRLFRCLLISGILMSLPVNVRAMPKMQDDPADQCAKGAQLLDEQRYDEALPLVEAGFTNRNQGYFKTTDDLGRCALLAGILRAQVGKYDEAIEAYNVARQAVEHSTDYLLSWSTLNYTTVAYYSLYKYEDALKISSQALLSAGRIEDPTARSRAEGQTLYNTATIYIRQERYVEAVTIFEQALVKARQVQDRKTEGNILNNLGSIHVEQGQYDEALSQHKQALQLAQDTSDQISKLTALHNIATVYIELGDYQKALDIIYQVLSETKDAGEKATTLTAIGRVLTNMGRYQEALQQFQQAIMLAEQAGNISQQITILSGIGLVYMRSGRYVASLETYNQALEKAKMISDKGGQALVLSDMANVYKALGRYSEAINAYLGALQIERSLSLRGHEASTLNNLGQIYQDQGNLQKALDLYQQSLDVHRTTKDVRGEAAVLTSIGTIYHSQGRLADAEQNYKQTLRITTQIGDQIGIATSNIDLGALFLDQGNFNDALPKYQESLRINKKIGNQQGIIESLNGLGSIYLQQGRADDSINTYRQALTIAQSIGDRAAQANVSENIGFVLLRDNRYEDAIAQYNEALTISHDIGANEKEGAILASLSTAYQLKNDFDQSLQFATQAMSVLEGVRAVAGSDQGRASFIAQYAHLYTNAALLAHQQGQDDLAFQISERGRARAFLDSLATGTVQLSDQEAQALLTREQETYTTRQAAQDALAKARAAAPPDQALITDLEQQLTTATQAHDQAVAAITQRGDQLAALVPSRTSSVLDRAAVQQLLDPQTTLVSYFVLDDQILAFVLSRERFQTVVLPVQHADLVTQVQALRRFADTSEPAPASAQQLFAWLIAPLRPFLTTSHLAIVPHDVLHYLPFAALTDGTRALLDDYTLTVLPSASSLPFIQRNSGRAPAAPLILGNPTTTDATLRPLAFAEQEAQAIGQVYGVTPLLGAQATARTLRAQAGQAGMVHLAAHGSYNANNPLESVIALAPDGDDDGRLTVRAVYGLNLHAADLVVLSACETQLGARSAGDEVVGLSRAFFFAGTPSVLATLWSVDDAATAEVMEGFYRHLWSGKSKAEALQAAQQEVRVRHPNPYYWAGFVLSGDGGVTHEGWLPWWGWVGVGVGVLVLGLVSLLLWRQRRSKRDIARQIDIELRCQERWYMS